MTQEQQAAELFEEWAKQFTPFNDGVQFEKDGMIAFAAFCLEGQSRQTGLKDANGSLIEYGDTIESFDFNGKSVRHTIEKDPETGLPRARYGPNSTCHVYQQWINEFSKVKLKP